MFDEKSPQYVRCQDADSYDERGVYEQTCPICLKKHTILSQDDNCPEYYTSISTFCECGEKLDWELPVN